MTDGVGMSVERKCVQVQRQLVGAALRVMFVSVLALLAAGSETAQAQLLQFTNQSFPLTQVGQSTTQNVLFTSTDNISLNSLKIASGYGEYTLNTLTGCALNATLAAGNTCTLSITFTPQLPGWATASLPIARSAPLEIAYWDEDTSTSQQSTIALTGTGTGPVAAITPGLISDLVGSDLPPIQSSYGGDGALASGAIFNNPAALAVDGLGNLYIADKSNSIVRVVYVGGDVLANLIALENPGTTATIGNIYTVAGQAQIPGSGTDGVLATQSNLALPAGVAVDAAGNIYISDTFNQAVREVSAATGFIQTVAGTLNSAGYTGDAAMATAAQLNYPTGITIDGNGNLYIADSGNQSIRVVYIGGLPLAGLIATENPGISAIVGDIYTLASGPGATFESGNTTLAYATSLSNPTAVAVDSQGNIFIADTGDAAIRRVDAVSGTMSWAYWGHQIFGITVDASDNIYFGLTYGCQVEQYNPQVSWSASYPWWWVTTVAGNGAVDGSGNCIASGDGGNATQAGLSGVQAVVADGTGSLYILEPDGVRYVNSSATSLTFPQAQFGILSPQLSVSVADADILNYSIGAPYLSSTTALTEKAGTVGLTVTPPFQVVPPFLNPMPPYPVVDCGTNALNLSPGQVCSIAVSVDSTSDSSYADAAIYLDNSFSFAGAPLSINLSATVVGSAPTVSLTGGPLSFYAVPNGGPSAGQNLILTNLSSTTPLAISSITTSTGFVASSCGTTLAAGASCTITVTFSTSATVVQNGSVTVHDDASTGGGVQSAAVSGTGIYPTAALTGGPLNFVSVVNEGASASQPLTLTNTSLVPLTITLIYPGSLYYYNAQGFNGNNNCGTTLPALQSCTINVTYSANTAAPQSYTLAVTDNATTGGGSQTAQLNGTGTAPVATISTSLGTPTSINFGSLAAGATSAPVLVTIQNTGTAPLTFCSYPGCAAGSSGIPPVPFSITGVTESQFSYDASVCGAGLAIGASCTVKVYFSPQTAGGFSATLSINDDSGGQNLARGSYATQSINLSGTGNIPVGTATFTLANNIFPATVVGSSTTQTITLQLHNALALKSFAIQTGFTEYSLGSITGCAVDGTTVNPAGSICSIPVTFTPSAPGLRSAPLVLITAQSGGTPYVFGLSGMGTGTVAALTPGIMSKIVGGGTGVGFSGIGGPANLAQVGYLNGMALDSAGNIYLSDNGNDVIWHIDTSGKINLYAGHIFTSGGYLQGLSGDGGPAIGASIAYGGPLATDIKGALYIGDYDGFGTPWKGIYHYDSSIRTINPVNGIISTVAGNGNGCSAETDIYGDGCTALQIAIQQVTGLVLDQAGNIYFSDSGMINVNSQGVAINHSAVRRIDAVTGIVTIVAGTGSQGHNGDGGLATAAEVNPGDLTLDSNGNLYIQEPGAVRMVNLTTGMITTVAGNGTTYNGNRYEICTGGSGDGGLGSAAKFNVLTGMAIDAANDLYLLDNGSCHVRRIDSGTGVINNVVGSNAGYSNYITSDYGDIGNVNSDGSAFDANLGSLTSVRLDGMGNMYLMQEAMGLHKVNVSQSVMNFGSALVDTASSALTTTVINAGNSGQVLFETPFLAPPWGISSNNWTRDVTNPTGVADCYDVHSVAVGYECPINTDFTPLVDGTLTGVTTVNDSAANNPQSITLMGVANGTGPNVTLLPFLLSFSTPQNGRSTPQTLTLSNNGSASVSLSSIALAGNGKAGFSQTNNCPTTLLGGSNCTIWVVFNPPLVGGSFVELAPPDILTAQVVVTDSDPSAPQISNLIGIGTLPAAASAINLAINETIHVTDVDHEVLPTLLNINEVIQATDAMTSIQPATQLAINEAIHVADVSVPVAQQIVPTLNWITPAPIPYGTTLGSLLNASAWNGAATVSGSYAYTATPLGGAASPASNTTVLAAGSYILTVKFTPSNPATYTIATATVALQVTADAQTIVFTDNLPATANYSAGLSYPISATGGASGNPVLFQVSGPATLGGNTLTITGSGTVVVTANQAGNNNFSPGQGTQTIKIALSAQSITFPALASPVTYGVSPITLGALASSGLPVSYSVTGPATLNGGTLTITGVGTVKVTAAQIGNSNFVAASSIAQSILVNPAKLTVTANNVGVGVGSAIPALTASFSGFVNGDTSATLGGAPALSTTATSSSPAGTYLITLTQGTLSAANYTFAFVNGTLTLAPALTVQISASSTVTGSAAAGYTLAVTIKNTGTGVANNLKLTSATLGTTTASTLPAGVATLAAGASTTLNVNFSSSVGPDGKSVSEAYAGSYSGGSFSGSARSVSLP